MKKKIIVAPNAFKGSLTAEQAARAITDGITSVYTDAEIITFLISDGGDGFIQSLQYGLGAEYHSMVVTGPLGSPTNAGFLFSEQRKIAILEMATSSGLALLNEDELDPMYASSYGFGELIVAALDLGAEHLVLGIGGSATNDGGMGMASALGIQFLDSQYHELAGNAENLEKISHINMESLDPRLNKVSIEVACDVSNPLLGEEGAAAVYAPQKGANSSQVESIETGLAHLADLIKREIGVDVRSLDGGGAAGGLGAGLFAFLSAKLKPGAKLLLDILEFNEQLSNASLLITTEGKLDYQTGFGKAPSIVAKEAQKLHIPTIVIAGQVENNNLNWIDYGFDNVYSLTDQNTSVNYAITHAAELLTIKTRNIIQNLNWDEVD